MVAEKNESTRSLLDQIEGQWDSPGPGEARKVAPPEVQAALDAAADRLVESLDPPPVSVPMLDELDSGWGDDEEEEDEDDEEIEPELPDERLDPVAYAAAKKARDERVEARRVRRRAKAEAKKSRRKARLDAQKQKQKGKQKKARTPNADARARAKAEAKASPRTARSRPRDDAGADGDHDAREPDALDEAIAAPVHGRGKTPPSRPMSSRSPMLSKTNQWMLGGAVIVFVAAAIFAAVVAR